MSISDAEKNRFLEVDLYNAFRYLFEGAIAWWAWKTPNQNDPAICRHQGVLGMYTAFMEARALYDFFHTRKRNNGDGDNALADHFVRNWKANQSDVYKDYMASRLAGQ